MKTFLVTGASAGIGRAIVERAVEAGEQVIAWGRDASRLHELRRELGDQVRIGVIDVADAEAVRSALATLGPLDALVLCAGICRQASLAQPDFLAVWDEVMQTNLRAVAHCLHAALPHLGPGGRIVAIGSTLARTGRAGYSAYAASKHGLLGLVRSAALELAPRGITVNAVCPGWVDTAMAAEDLRLTATRTGVDPDEARDRALSRIPIGRMIAPEEVAALVTLLLQDSATAITGEAFGISGGELLV
jgi:NAD(P)-dependent dehydrogenase (short-subunit alcohol dehydrogenase family)